MEPDSRDLEMTLRVGRYKNQDFNADEILIGGDCEKLCRGCLHKCSIVGESQSLILTRILTGRLLEQPDLCDEMIAKINKYKML